MPIASWTTATIAGHACDVFEPVPADEAGFTVLYLHGIHLTRLVDNESFSALFHRYQLRVLAPLTGPCFWANRICRQFDSRITPEDHLVRNVVAYATERWRVAPPAMALLGTSMGGQGALRIAFRYPNLFPVVAALSPAIDYQIRYDDEAYDTLREMYPDAESARQDTATLQVHPLNWPRNIFFACDPNDWPWIESAQRLAMKLSALGIPHETDLETVAGGHGFGYYNHMAGRAIEFIVERLERERRRAG